jgi:hypothetical protein
MGFNLAFKENEGAWIISCILELVANSRDILHSILEMFIPDTKIYLLELREICLDDSVIRSTRVR